MGTASAISAPEKLHVEEDHQQDRGVSVLTMEQPYPACVLVLGLSHGKHPFLLTLHYFCFCYINQTSFSIYIVLKCCARKCVLLFGL